MSQSLAVTPETLPAIMWQNQPVITTELLAEIYGTAIDNIQMNFTRNASRFIEGVHYFLLKGADLKAFKANQLSVGQLESANPISLGRLAISKFTRSLYLWTERGTVRHAKILDTDNAWAVQDRLEDFYFTKNQPKPYGLRELPPATPKTLTPAMLRHIQKRVSWLAFNQVGSTHAVLGKLIKDTFNVHKRDMIPIEKYAEVCTLLGCEPNAKALQGDLLEPAKVEYQPPAGMVLIDVAELEALQIPDDKLLVDKRLHEALIEFQYSLPVDNKLTFSPPAGIATLKIEDYEVMKFKAAQFDKLKGILKA